MRNGRRPRLLRQAQGNRWRGPRLRHRRRFPRVRKRWRMRRPKLTSFEQSIVAITVEVSMRYATMILAFLSASALCSGGGRAADAANSQFFNGKNVEGWEGLSQYWSVKDGALVGSTFPKGLGF